MVELCQKTTRLKSKLSYVGLSLQTEIVHMEIPVLLLMVIMSFKRKNMFHLGIRQSSASNSMKAHTVLMVIDANLFTQPNWTKFNKRNKLKLKKILVMILLLSLVTNKCWMIILSVLSKDLQAHRTLI